MVKEEKKKTTKKAAVKEKLASKKSVAGVESAGKPPVKKKEADLSAEKKAVVKKTAVPEGASLALKERAAPVAGELHLGTPGRERYFEAVGRRKTAVARVRLFTKAGDFMVNNKLYSVYFSTVELLKISEDALQKMKLFGRFKVTAQIKGGGMHAQAEALRQGLSRCLVKFNPDFRKRLRRADFLKRDPRMKERKKPGLKRARKAPQWSKR